MKKKGVERGKIKTKAVVAKILIVAGLLYIAVRTNREKCESDEKSEYGACGGEKKDDEKEKNDLGGGKDEKEENDPGEGKDEKEENDLGEGNSKMRRRAVVSKILIAAGALCVAAPIVIEVLSVPWLSLADANVNEVVLEDPSLPDFEYINYSDIPRSELIFTLTPLRENDAEQTQVLPGEEVAAPVASKPAASKPKEIDTSKFVLLGNIKIPRISVSENLFEGTQDQMKAGVGHVEGTAMPGEPGNSVLAAHRVSSALGKKPFRHLDKLQNGDRVTISFNDRPFAYEVFDSFIVTKYDTWVMDPLEDETHVLTLVTCDPLVNAGNRPNRLIVRARLTETE